MKYLLEPRPEGLLCRDLPGSARYSARVSVFSAPGEAAASDGAVNRGGNTADLSSSVGFFRQGLFFAGKINKQNERMTCNDII